MASLDEQMHAILGDIAMLIITGLWLVTPFPEGSWGHDPLASRNLTPSPAERMF